MVDIDIVAVMELEEGMGMDAEDEEDISIMSV